MHFFDLPTLLGPGDCLVLNDSRVLPARLIGRRSTGGACEVLLLIDRGEGLWECLVRPGRKMKPGAQLSFGEGKLTATVEAELPGGNRLVRFHYQGIFLEILEELGRMPLPPYIKAELQDNERYQTVYSKVLGSAAAPTAGLHFTPELLRQVEEMRRLEDRVLPRDMDYLSIHGLRMEARQKLQDIRPRNLGQASRVSGVSPADVAVLMIYLKQAENATH